MVNLHKQNIIEVTGGGFKLVHKYKRTLINGVDLYVYTRWSYGKIETFWSAYKDGINFESCSNTSPPYGGFKGWLKKLETITNP